MSRRGRYLLFLALLLADAGGVVVALIASALLLARSLPLADYIGAIQLALPAWLLVFAALRLYDLETVLEDSQEYATLATGCTYGILVLVVVNALAGRGFLPLLWLLASWFASILAVGAGRFFMRRVVRAMRRAGHLITRAVIVGADEQGRTIARQFRSVADSGVHVVGFVDDFLPPGTPVDGGLTVLGHPGALRAIARDHRVAEVVVVPGALAWETFREILEGSAFADGLRIRLSPGYYDLLATTPRVAHRNFVPLIVMDRVRLSGFDAVMKTALDYGAGLVALVLTLPVAGLVALTLWLARVRPLFNRVQYVGMGGRAFAARVFRLPAPGGLARLLDETGLDHLPLLAWVLLGRLSLVGPRPIPLEEKDRYARWLPSLATVRPGVTGPWAVVPIASLEEEMRAALYYIRNWTIWLDLQILAQTALVILRRRWERLS